MKTCSKCNETKELTEFHRNKTHKDGRLSTCKSCHRTRVSAYKADNREQIAENHSAYRKANLAKFSAYAAKGRCGSAAPSWIDDSHDEAIVAVYEEAESLGHHVDHIVPRNHPLVSGLHVAWNLQPLPPKANITKRNYLPLDPEYSFIHQHDGKAYDSATGQLVPTT